MTYGVAPNAVALNSDGFVLAAPVIRGDGASNVTASELELSFIPYTATEEVRGLEPDDKGLYRILIDDYPPGTIVAVNFLTEKGLRTLDEYDISLTVNNRNSEEIKLDLVKDNDGNYGFGQGNFILLPFALTTDNTMQLFIEEMASPFGELTMNAKHKLKGFTMELKVDFQWDESVDLNTCGRLYLSGEYYLTGDKTEMSLSVYAVNVIGEPILNRGGDIAVTYSNPEHLNTPLYYDPVTQTIILDFKAERTEDLRGTLTVTMDQITIETQVGALK